MCHHALHFQIISGAKPELWPLRILQPYVGCLMLQFRYGIDLIGQRSWIGFGKHLRRQRLPALNHEILRPDTRVRCHGMAALDCRTHPLFIGARLFSFDFGTAATTDHAEAKALPAQMIRHVSQHRAPVGVPGEIGVYEGERTHRFFLK